MIPVRNLNKKLVCEIKEDSPCVEIVRGDCKTEILLSPTGKHRIRNKRLKKPNR